MVRRGAPAVRPAASHGGTFQAGSRTRRSGDSRSTHGRTCCARRWQDGRKGGPGRQGVELLASGAITRGSSCGLGCAWSRTSKGSVEQPDSARSCVALGLFRSASDANAPADGCVQTHAPRHNRRCPRRCPCHFPYEVDTTDTRDTYTLIMHTRTGTREICNTVVRWCPGVRRPCAEHPN